jgi:hypothetical protein
MLAIAAGTRTFYQHGGVVHCHHLVTGHSDTYVYHIYGGIYNGWGERFFTEGYETVTVYGRGTFNYNAEAAATTITVNTGGTLSFDGGSGAVTVTTLNVYGGAIVKDASSRRSGTVNFVGCTVEDTVFQGAT